jgi:hypothetical protein
VVEFGIGSGVLDTEFFLTIAELSVALAGFGSLASLIGRRAGSESAAVDAGRLRGMLDRSLSVMILSIFPISLTYFELSSRIVWGVSGVLFAVAAPILFWLPLLRLRKLPEYQPSFAYQLSGHLSLAVTLGLLVSGLVGVLPLIPAYGVALVVELAVAAGMFLRVASSLMGSHLQPPA